MYQIIQRTGNKGAWTKDIRYQCGLPQVKLIKVLKSLEDRRLIKPVKSSTCATKKIYMLFELHPSEELTGGQWCAPFDPATEKRHLNRHSQLGKSSRRATQAPKVHAESAEAVLPGLLQCSVANLSWYRAAKLVDDGPVNYRDRDRDRAN